MLKHVIYVRWLASYLNVNFNNNVKLEDLRQVLHGSATPAVARRYEDAVTDARTDSMAIYKVIK